MASIVDTLDIQTLIRGLSLALFLVFVSQFLRELADGFPYWHIPIVGRGRWELSNSKAKARYVHSAKELLSQGFSEVCGGSQDVPMLDPEIKLCRLMVEV